MNTKVVPQPEMMMRLCVHCIEFAFSISLMAKQYGLDCWEKRYEYEYWKFQMMDIRFSFNV